MTVGVLAVQGDFAAHAQALSRAGYQHRLVRSPHDFDVIEALIIPGGESTAMLRGIVRDRLDGPLRAFIAARRPMLGTCAGAIVLATRVVNPIQQSFAALDVDIERNAYGTQLDSFDTVADVDDDRSPFAAMHCVLIRAPRITRMGSAVRVHARIDGAPVLVSQGPFWAATFHPELTDDARVLNAVLNGGSSAARPAPPRITSPQWRTGNR